MEGEDSCALRFGEYIVAADGAFGAEFLANKVCEKPQTASKISWSAFS